MFGLAAGLTAIWLAAASMQSPQASVSPAMALWRLDCGEIHVADLDQYSDAYLYKGQQKTLTNSCYLVRHGDRYLLWDTGLSADLAGRTQEEGGDRLTLRRTIADQLGTIGIRPDQITFVGISHYHFDHTGQAASFPTAKLLVRKPDCEAVRGREDRAERFRLWIDGGGDVQPVQGDHDVFGDGRVVMLSTPGHTPGHHSLLVRLPRSGAILLTGDVYHFTESVASEGVPGFNTSRADTLASMDRLQRIAQNLPAKIIIQHDPADVGSVPAFPAAGQ